MALKFNCILFGILFSTVVIASLFLHASAAPGCERGDISCRWVPITDIKYPQLVEIGKFAVDQHNKESESKSKLVFKRVVKGETQVVDGTYYRLVIFATDGGRRSRSVDKYLAEVWDKPWENFRNLTSFKKL